MNNRELILHRLRLRARRVAHDLGDRWYLASHRSAPPRIIPDFALIGAMKTGTTSLHNYLSAHPDVYMTHIKEPGLFLDAPPYLAATPYLKTRERLERITFRGYASQRLIGESSTYYSEAPTLGLEAPEHMAESAPDIKLIYMLRNPIDRIFSHYWHCIDLEIYDEPIDAILAKDTTFLERSSYYYQLSRYLQHFPADRIHVVLLEDFKKDSAAVLEKICAFLDLEVPPPAATQPAKQYNRSISRTATADAATKLSPETYEALIGPLQQDISKLESFLNRSLDLWDLSPERWCHTQPETTSS